MPCLCLRNALDRRKWQVMLLRLASAAILIWTCNKNFSLSSSALESAISSGAETVSKTDFHVSDGTNISEYTLPHHGGNNCTSYFVHRDVKDGFGHQLLDLNSLMVYHYVNDDGVCFLAHEEKMVPFEHKCTSCTHGYKELNRRWHLSVKDAMPNVPMIIKGDLWKEVTQTCREPPTKTEHNPKCDWAREKVARMWVEVVRDIAKNLSVPQLDIALHIRKGDLPRKISNSYAKVMENHFPGARIDVFTENEGESSEIFQQLNTSHQIVLHAGGDAFKDWLLMATARVLFQHQSSYSTSASIASEGIVFSQTQKPQQGRYDGNIFMCPTVAGWWMSFGHGTTTCPKSRLEEVERTVRDGKNFLAEMARGSKR